MSVAGLTVKCGVREPSVRRVRLGSKIKYW